MREILFRGKTKYNEWLYWNEYGATVDKNGSPKAYNIDMLRVIYVDTARRSIIPETVGQFTGLTDRNGKRIFEWDIGRYKQTDGAKRNGTPIICTGKVIYNATTASYAVESKDEEGCKYFDYFPIKDFEVIGNIHDNNLEDFKNGF